MPLFEYRCSRCDERFEMFVVADARPHCPRCESASVQKLLSVFAVSSGDSRGAVDSDSPNGCGTCGDPRGPGSCAN